MESRNRPADPARLSRVGFLFTTLTLAVAVAVGSGLGGGLLTAEETGRQSFKVPQGRVDNVRFERTPGGIVTVYYDLATDQPGAVFSITLEVSPPDGEPRLAKSVTGDVGSNVKPGTGKKIVWDANKDVESLQLDRFRFKVLAEAGPVKKVDDRGAAAPAARSGSLIITSNPPGATVLVDGANRGKAPVTLNDVSPGKHKVQFTLAGYLDNVRQVDLAIGQTQTIDATLTPGEAAPEKKGGSKLKWILPLAGGAAAAAVVLASSGGDDGGTDGGNGCTTPCCNGGPAVQVSSVTASPTDVGLESITEFTFTAQGINGCRESNTTVNIVWDFGDGTTSSAANVDTTHTVTHTYSRSSTFTVKATVTDGRPSSASASKDGVVVSNMNGSWAATDRDGIKRIFALTQSATQLTGTYTAVGGQTVPASGLLSKPKNISVTGSGGSPPISPVTVAGTIAADVRSFTGLVSGGGASNQTLTFTKQ